MDMLRIAWHGYSNYPPSLARETLEINTALGHTYEPQVTSSGKILIYCSITIKNTYLFIIVSLSRIHTYIQG